MPRRILEGQVVSDKMDKTVTVLVERRFMHPVYKKYVKRTDKYAAHDENNAFKDGDKVQIEECRPVSRRKTWNVVTAPASVPTKKVAPVKAEEAQKEEPKKEAVKKPAAKKAAPKKEAVAKKPVAKKAPAKKAPAKKKDDK